MSQSDPTNFFDVLFRYFLLLGVAFFSLFFIGRSQTVAPPMMQPTPTYVTSDPSTFASPTLIDTVEVLVMESMPPTIQLVVSGSQPDGCELPVVIRQTREGNIVRVQIFREMSPAMTCAMILQPYSATIPLDGSFEPGTYQIDINGFIVEVTI